MLNPFAILRDMARSAVKNGVLDALDEVTEHGDPLVNVDELRKKIANNTAVAALPAAGEEKKGGRK